MVTTAIDLPFTPGSIGRPINGVQVRIVDENGDDAFVGDSGEIWVKGPNVFSGYLNDPEATARVLTDDGWLKTGDIAVVDEHGNIFMVDRAKDLIIVSGFNVFPAEVEDVLKSHPDIVDAAVVDVEAEDEAHHVQHNKQHQAPLLLLTTPLLNNNSKSTNQL